MGSIEDIFYLRREIKLLQIVEKNV